VDVHELEKAIRKSFIFLLDRPRTPYTIHVSALPFCLRKEFFNVRFHASPASSTSAVVGRVWHLAVQHLDVLQGCEFERPVEAELKNGYRLSGKIDAYDPKNRVVYEFKFAERLSSSELDGLYFAQANAYA